jgi:hypothetical protein
MTRRPAHPPGCDCCICADGRQLEELDEALSRDRSVHRCSTCAMHAKCDGHLRVTSLTESLAPYYIDKGNNVIVDALGKECRQWKGR